MCDKWCAHEPHLWIECSRMAGLLDMQYAFDPRDYFVTARVCRLVQVDKTAAHIIGDGTLQRRAALSQRRVVVGANIQFIEILREMLVPTR